MKSSLPNGENFWEQVRGNGYSEEDISEELQQLMCGGVWVDFLDDRTVSVQFAKCTERREAVSIVGPRSGTACVVQQIGRTFAMFQLGLRGKTKSLVISRLIASEKQ